MPFGRDLPSDFINTYPGTADECRDLVVSTFNANRWNQDEQATFLSTNDIDGRPGSVEVCGETQIFQVLDKLIIWNMVLVDPDSVPIGLDKVLNVARRGAGARGLYDARK